MERQRRTRTERDREVGPAQLERSEFYIQMEASIRRNGTHRLGKTRGKGALHRVEVRASSVFPLSSFPV